MDKGDVKKEVKNEEAEPGLQPVPFRELFRYCSPSEVPLIVLGVIGSLGSGAQRPVSTIIMGNILAALSASTNIIALLRLQCIYYCYIAAASAVCGLLQGWAWSLLAERISNRIRKEYLHALLRTEIAFFDSASQGSLVARLSSDVALVHGAVGQKAGLLLQYFSTFVSGMVIGFYDGWRLALVMLAVVPILVFSGAASTKLSAKASTRQQAADAAAGARVAELFSGIRTVSAFTGERMAERDHTALVAEAARLGAVQKMSSGVGFGWIMCCVFCIYALVLWYGTELIRSGEMRGSTVVTTFFAVMMAGSSIGQIAPSVDAFARGRGAAAALYEVIDREPQIDATSETGATLPSPKGELTLDAVWFTYASRTGNPVFSGLTLEMKAGESTALVGESGSGKSSVISLLLRFYDPQQGCVRLDGVDIKSLNLRWLRAQYGLVSQVPVLFAEPLRQNLLYGKPDATQEELEAACRAAHAHNFISAMADGYDTFVGDRGMQLSGGQKQRLAIARAILRDPPVLLLDEATSALDGESEHSVQLALADIRAAKGRTTVTVAHRLKTITDADAIVVLRAGRIVERGTHEELKAKEGGAYAALLAMQAMRPVGSRGQLSDEGVKEERQPQREEAKLPSSSAPGKDEVRMLELVSVDAPAAASETDEKGKAAGGDGDGKEEKPPWDRLYALCRPERHYIVLGVVSAAVMGCFFPVFSIILSRLLEVFFEPKNKISADARFWCIMFSVLGAANLIVASTMAACAAQLSRHVGQRMRTLSLHAALRQEVSYFEAPENATGALASRIASDAQALRLLLSDGLFASLQNVSTLFAGLAIAFSGGWQLALVMIGIMPLTGASFYLTAKRLGALAGDTRKEYERCTQIASDALANIRTVAAFGAEAHVMRAFEKALERPAEVSAGGARISGYNQAFSQAMATLPSAFAFYIGGIYISKGILNFQQVMQVFFALIMSAVGMSQVSAATSEVGNAKPSLIALFRLLDRTPLIDAFDDAGLRPEPVRGELLLKDVCFAYPSRPEQPVLRSLQLHVAAGTTHALIGESGSGKSSVISLLLRFYDPTSGAVYLDGNDLRQLNLHWLRTRIAVVSQEPTLFAASIAENISYGQDNVTEKQIEAAAAAAHAAGFIADLPGGYKAQVGERGVQLSGGQQQRIAIARAVMRNPPVLLLDEATSALDSASERAVQAALSTLQEGRTCLVIAHNLSTVRDAHVLSVMAAGVVVEEGSHESLMALGGRYAHLVAARGEKGKAA